VTFLFTDVEGSTRLVQEIGGERFAAELMEHRDRVREIVIAFDGVEFGTEGDAFFIAFSSATRGLAAAEAMQSSLSDGPMRIRIGMHSGEPLVVEGDYVGLDVHKAARICSAAHGGQVLVSDTTRELVRADLRDLGFHRLKDLGTAERLWQLGDREFPPLRTLRRGNLPVQPNPLLGRQRELTELIACAASHRLVTLTGPGGVGKTRLALAVAAELSEQTPDGAWWVPLAAVSDPELVLPSVSQAVGAPDGLVEFLLEKQLLLVLDNLEQVVHGAPRIADLLAEVPGLRAIATSREALAIAAEHEYRVPVLEEQPAVELFITRARQVKPNFRPEEAVAQICARLDQLPLAIELAATRARVMAPAEILAKLDQRLSLLVGGRRDLPERQATLRATIDWSYDLLPELEQEQFRAISVFEGSFDRDAAEGVCGTTLEGLESLIAKSLLRQTAHDRFFLLETLHDYAREQLADANEAERLQRRHAQWFLERAASASAALHGEHQHVWLDWLRAENDNLRAVLAWTLEEDLASGLALADTLFRPWHMRGQLPELIRWYERALRDAEGIESETLASALRTYGSALLFTEQYQRAEQVLTKSLGLSRRAGDPIGEAEALNTLGSVASSIGQVHEALRLHYAALKIARRVGDQRVAARSLHLAGEDLTDLQELDRARAMLEEAATLDTELGDRLSAMTSLHSLGDLALDGVDTTAAESRYREALQICHELADERSQAYCLAGLACVAALRGDTKRAGQLWGVASELENHLGLRMLAKERQRYERILDARADDPNFRAGREAAHQISLGQVIRELLVA
jgi:predicted ATPase